VVRQMAELGAHWGLSEAAHPALPSAPAESLVRSRHGQSFAAALVAAFWSSLCSLSFSDCSFANSPGFGGGGIARSRCSISVSALACGKVIDRLSA
jgi:hypothetical protein